MCVKCIKAIAQEIISWFLVKEARVQSQGSLCEVYGGQSGSGLVFLRVLWFSLGNNHTTHFPYLQLSFGAGSVCSLST